MRKERISDFLINGSCKLNNSDVESIELVEFYLETSSILLDRTAERIWEGFIKIN